MVSFLLPTEMMVLSFLNDLLKIRLHIVLELFIKNQASIIGVYLNFFGISAN